MSAQLFRTRHYAAYDVQLRAAFLRVALRGAALIVALYLLQGALGLFRPRLFPWDGLMGLALTAVCIGLYRQGRPQRISLAASWLVAGVNILAAFYSQSYGVRHPVTAIYLAGIVLAGMLIGGWFLRLWSAMGALFILTWAYFELRGAVDTALDPVSSWGELWGTVLLWWTLMGLTAWLMEHFAHYLERAVQISRAQTAAMAGTLDALAREPELDTFLREVLTAIVEQLEAHCATLFLHDSEGDLLFARLSYVDGRVQNQGEAAPLAPAPIAAGDLPLWNELVERREPLVVEDVHKDARLEHGALTPAQDIQAVLYVPLLQRGHVSGFFSISHKEPWPFARTEIELAQALAQQATLAMQLAQLAQHQEQSAVIAERNRLAREIHDTLAQGFTGILIQLEAAEDLLAEGQASLDAGGGRVDALAHLARARTLARDSLQEARRSVKALRPRALEGQDLPAAVRHMVQQLTIDSGIQATVTIEGEPRPLPAPLPTELLRITQEALTNALKHSGAANVYVTLSYDERSLALGVRDDGGGFDTRAAHGGFGFTSMRERALLIGAHLDVSSELGEGTQLSCVVPLPAWAGPAP